MFCRGEIFQFLFWVVLTNIIGFYCFRNMVLAERCVLLSAEILKSQSKYSEAAALLIRLTSEVSSFFHFFFSPLLSSSYRSAFRWHFNSCSRILAIQDSKWPGIKLEMKKITNSPSWWRNLYFYFFLSHCDLLGLFKHLLNVHLTSAYVLYVLSSV